MVMVRRAIALIASLLMLLVTVHNPAYAASMVGGWEQPAPMNNPAAGWLANGCNGSQAYFANEVHTGLDYKAPLGTEVKTIESGTVAGNLSFGVGYGRAVFVRHVAGDGTTFLALYGHIDSAIAQGTTVARGQVIGTLAPLRDGIPPHLHFGILPGTSYPSNNWGNVPCGTTGTNGFVDPNGFLAAHPLTSGNVIGKLVQFNKPNTGGWTPWQISANSISGKPAVLWGEIVNVLAVDDTGRLQQYAANNGAWNIYPTPVTSMQGGVGAYMENSGTIHAFLVSNDGRLHQVDKSSAGPWITNDISKQRFAKGAPAVLWGSTEVNVFVVGQDGSLLQYNKQHSDNNWNAFQVLPANTLAGGVDAFQVNPTTIEVFGAGVHGELVQVEKLANQPWNASAISAPNMVKGTPSVLWGSSVDVFSVDTQNAIRQFSVPLGGSNWTSTAVTANGVVNGGVSAVRSSSTSIEVFATW